MSALTWKRGTTETSYGMATGTVTVTQTVYDTTVGSLDFRIRKVDDLWFIETRKGDAPYGNPGGGHPLYRDTLRAAKAEVQDVVDTVDARLAAHEATR